MHSRIHLTGRALVLLSKRGFQRGHQWLLARGREFFHCRDCGQQIGPFEPICLHCGAGNPAKIVISPTTTLCGLGLFTLIGWYFLV